MIPSMAETILIVEDDRELRDYLRETLVTDGYVVWVAKDAMETKGILEKKHPDLVLLDLGLPVITGESLLKEIKDTYPEIKVIILTGKDQLNTVLEGFALGADDFVKKPFQTEELLARIKARLSHDYIQNDVLQLADLEINFASIEVKRGGKNITLTPQEFKLLEYLAVNNGRVLPREMILGRLWGEASDAQTRVVDVYVGYLRKKIDADFDRKLIKSVRGFGYMIDVKS